MPKTLKFGRYKGADICDVPTEYLEYLLGSAEQTIRECSAELERRAAIEEADFDWAERVIAAGLRELAKRHHPDLNGGNGEEMKAINAAASLLREMVRNGR